MSNGSPLDNIPESQKQRYGIDGDSTQSNDDDDKKREDSDTSPTPEGVPPDPANGPVPSEETTQQTTQQRREEVEAARNRTVGPVDGDGVDPSTETSTETKADPLNVPQEKPTGTQDTTTGQNQDSTQTTTTPDTSEVQSQSKSRLSQPQQEAQNQLDVSTPDVYRDRSILQEEFNIDAESREGFEEQLQSTAAQRFTDATVSELRFGADDVTLQETDDGLRPTLTDQARQEIALFQEEGFEANLRQAAADRFNADPTDVIVSEGGDGYGVSLTQEEREARAEAEAVESLRQGVDPNVFGITQSEAQELAQMGPQEREQFIEEETIGEEDVSVQDGQVQLDDPVAQDIQQGQQTALADQLSAEFDTTLLPSDVTPEGDLTQSGERQVASERIDEQTPNVDIGAEDITEVQSDDQLNPTGQFSDDGFTLDQQARQEVARAQTLDALLGREDVEQSDIASIDVSPTGRATAEFTDAFQREQVAEQINEDDSFLPMHDEVEFTAEDVMLQGDDATLSESGEAKVEDALVLDALNELSYETGTDLGREDVTVQETDDGLQVGLSEEGEEAVEIERSFGTDLPFVGGAFTEGVKIRRDIRGLGEPVREAAGENIPGVEEYSKWAAAAAPVAVAEPTPVGEISIGTAGLAVGGVAAGSVVVNEALGYDPKASTTASTSAFEGDELQVPEDGDVVTSNELGVPSGGDVVIEDSELQPTETPLTSGGEIPTGTGDVFGSEVSVPTPTNQVNPEVLQTQLLEGVVREKQEQDQEDATTPTIPDDDIFVPEPVPEDQPAPSNRERQRREDLDPFERTFPTGGSAVVDEPTDRVDEAETPQVPQDTVTEGTEAGIGQPQTPVSGVTDRLDEAQDQEVTTDPTTIERPTQTPFGDVGTGLDDIVGITPAERGAEQADTPLDQVLDVGQQAQATSEQTPDANATGPGYGFGQPFQYGTPTTPAYGYDYEYGYGTPDPERPERDGNGDNEPLFGSAEREILTEFRNPLSGNTPDGGGLFGGSNDSDNPFPW